MDYKPRPYQAETISKLEDAYHRGIYRNLIVKATGLGKTVSFSFLLDHYRDLIKQYGALVMAHRGELIFQAADTIREITGLHVGIEKADYRAGPSAEVIVGTVQTLGRSKRRLQRAINILGGAFLVVTDECHHVTEGSMYDHVLGALGMGSRETSRSERVVGNGIHRMSVGFTATPNRHDGVGLSPFYDGIPISYDLRWGIDHGYLVEPEIFTVETGHDLTNVGAYTNDFVQRDLNESINDTTRNSAIVSAWKKYSEGEKALAFTAGVEHAHSLAGTFEDAGYAAEAVDGETPKDRRKRIVDRFRNGALDVLCNCGCFTEGFDAPAMKTILMARPTKSQPLYLQMLGRGTRPVVDLNVADVHERLRRIAESEKPAVKILDFVDVSDHEPVTAPSLFGLSKDMTLRGKRAVSEVVEKVEAVEKESPHKPVREAASFEEIDVIANRVDVWDIAHVQEEIKAVSDYDWMKLPDGSYQIQIPLNMRDEIMPGYNDRPKFIKLRPNALGAYELEEIWPSGYYNGQAYREGRNKKSFTFDSIEAAIESCDKVIERKYKDLENLMLHSPGWGEDEPSDGQLNYLQRLGFSANELNNVKNKGHASRLISAAKQTKKQG